LLVPEVATGNVVFYITLQSAKPESPRITVSLDGTPVISGVFPVGEHHPNYVEYHFDWSPGVHRLAVRSDNMATPLESTVNVTAKHWVVLYYGYAPNRRGFSLHSFDEPIRFE